MSPLAQKHCVVVTCFDKNQPGFLDFSYRIASLAKEYQLTVVSLNEITQPELIFENVNYRVFKVGEGKLGWMTYLVKCAIFIHQKKPDIIVLLHSAAAPITLLVGDVPSCLYWNEHPTNLVHLPGSFSPIRRMFALLFQRLVVIGAKHASSVMPISEDHRDDLLNNGIEPSKIHMIYMGVSDQFILVDSNKAMLGQPLRLMYIGTVSKARGRDVMLEAMALLDKSNKNVHLTIVGANDEQIKFCENRIVELDIKDYVSVLARVPGSQIPNYLTQADVGICLWESNSWNEYNPPTKLFEYLVAGIPVLASDIRTHTRYVSDLKNGLIFEYDAPSLAKAITKLIVNKNLFQSLKQHAKQSGQQYLWSKIQPIYLDVVRNLIINRVTCT